MQAEAFMRSDFEQQLADLRKELADERERNAQNTMHLESVINKYNQDHQKVLGLQKEFRDSVEALDAFEVEWMELNENEGATAESR